MGAKRKPSDAERQAQRLQMIRRRTTRALASELGVELDVLDGDDRAALAQAERNIAKLRHVGNRMRIGQAPTAPTAERRAHAPRSPREVEVNPATARAHHFQWSVDTIAGRLTQRQHSAAERFREKYFQAEPSSGVADTTGAGGASDPSKRLAMTEATELAAREVRWIADRLDAETKEIVNAFVLELAPPHTEKPLAIGEWSARRMKLGRDRAIGADIGLIRAACERLASLGAAYHAWQKEQCRRTDRMLRCDLGRRAGRDGWIVALWIFCHKNGRLPQLQGEVDAVRARHDQDAVQRRHASPREMDAFYKRRDRLTAFVFREDEAGRVRAVG